MLVLVTLGIDRIFNTDLAIIYKLSQSSKGKSLKRVCVLGRDKLATKTVGGSATEIPHLYLKLTFKWSR